jgi:very-short-patch-repair endonuclease
VTLYRELREFPTTLRGAGVLVPTAELPMSVNAARWRAARSRIARPYRGLYLLGPTPPDLADLAKAALAVAPPHAVVGFHTAAALLGFGVVTSADVHLVVPAGTAFPQRRGITVHQSVVPIGPFAVRGIRCTSPARTAIDLARVLPRPDALAVLDAALASQTCTPAELAEEVRRHRRLKGFRQASALVPLADGRAECAQETHLRLILRDARITSLVPQVPVRDRYGRVLYRLDLADEHLRVAAEYDGLSHLDRDRLRTDRARHNFLAAQHWRMRYFTDVDLYRRPDYVVRTVRAALADALADARARCGRVPGAPPPMDGSPRTTI